MQRASFNLRKARTSAVSRTTATAKHYRLTFSRSTPFHLEVTLLRLPRSLRLIISIKATFATSHSTEWLDCVVKVQKASMLATRVMRQTAEIVHARQRHQGRQRFAPHRERKRRRHILTQKHLTEPKASCREVHRRPLSDGSRYALRRSVRFGPKPASSRTSPLSRLLRGLQALENCCCRRSRRIDQHVQMASHRIMIASSRSR